MEVSIVEAIKEFVKHMLQYHMSNNMLWNLHNILFQRRKH